MRTLPACLIATFWGATALCAVAQPPKKTIADIGTITFAANAVTTPLQAPASTEKSEFFPDGLSATMEPADMWAIATTAPENEVPPPQFDHATKGPVTVIDVATEGRLRTLCGWPASKGEILVGCASVASGCTIYLGPTAGSGVTRNLVLRHELGHCNGWPRDHSNPPAKAAPLQVADKGVELDAVGAKPQPAPMPKARQVPEGRCPRGAQGCTKAIVVADGRDYSPRYDDDYLDEPPPRRLRRPYGPPPYYPPPPGFVPPGPVPCLLLQLVGLSFCI